MDHSLRQEITSWFLYSAKKLEICSQTFAQAHIQQFPETLGLDHRAYYETSHTRTHLHENYIFFPPDHKVSSNQTFCYSRVDCVKNNLIKICSLKISLTLKATQVWCSLPSNSYPPMMERHTHHIGFGTKYVYCRLQMCNCTGSLWGTNTSIKTKICKPSILCEIYRGHLKSFETVHVTIVSHGVVICLVRHN